jgi:TPP-dependent pyruvate/acetoin dehydrogenase alpha subunit
MAEQFDLAELVLRIRLTMLAVNEANRSGNFTIPIHLALGHEAVAAGLTSAKQEGDCLVLSHRNIHYNVASQPNPGKTIAEYGLLEEGQSRGKHGSMNLTNPDAGLVYTSSILGNNLCVAAGIAMGNKTNGENSVTFVVTGDGAMEEGAFYESVLMMKSLGLPVVVVIENNGWSMYTQIHERRCGIDLEKMGAALDIPYTRLSGNDVVDYTERLEEVRKQTIEQSGPSFVEVDIHTLGDFWTEEKPGAPSRLINYHHGVAPKIGSEVWPELEDNENDPVHVLKSRFPRERLEAAATSLHSAVAGAIQ